MEKSWDMKNWQTVIEVCDQSWNFSNFVPEFYLNCAFFANIKDRQGVSGQCAALGHINPQLWW